MYYVITVLKEEDVERGNIGKVEDVNGVPDGHPMIIIFTTHNIFTPYLNVGEGIHLLDSYSATHGQTGVQGFVKHSSGD